MKMPGALGAVLILLSAAALAGPGGGGGSHGGGGGGGSHGGGSSGGSAPSSHTSSAVAGHASGASPLGSIHPAATGTHVAMTPRMAASSAVQKPKPGFWKRHLHHYYAQGLPEINHPTLCTEEEMRLGRCPNRAATHR